MSAKLRPRAWSPGRSTNSTPSSSRMRCAMCSASSSGPANSRSSMSPSSYCCDPAAVIALSRRSGLLCSITARARSTTPRLDRKLRSSRALWTSPIAAVEPEDVLNAAAAPCVQELVVVADHGERRSQLGEGADQSLLDGVDVLVLVNGQVAHPRGDTCAEVWLLLEHEHGIRDDRTEVQVALVGEHVEVLLQARLDVGSLERGLVDVGFAQDRHQLAVSAGVAIAMPAQVGQPAPPRVARDQVPLLDVVEHAVGQRVVVVLLQQLEAEAVDRSDIEVGEPVTAARALLPAQRDPVLELGGGALVEREGDHVRRLDAGELQLLDDAARDRLGLAGAGARDQMDVLVEREGIGGAGHSGWVSARRPPSSTPDVTRRRALRRAGRSGRAARLP